MKLIICIDDRGGIAFNGRRQTRDKNQRRHLIKRLAGARLYISPYTYKMYGAEFDAENTEIIVSENYLAGARNDSCDVFAWDERENPAEYITCADEIRLYRWNRNYPSDVKFPTEKLAEYSLAESEEFSGTSHDRITFERYIRG